MAAFLYAGRFGLTFPPVNTQWHPGFRALDTVAEQPILSSTKRAGSRSQPECGDRDISIVRKYSHHKLLFPVQEYRTASSSFAPFPGGSISAMPKYSSRRGKTTFWYSFERHRHMYFSREQLRAIPKSLRRLCWFSQLRRRHGLRRPAWHGRGGRSGYLLHLIVSCVAICIRHPLKLFQLSGRCRSSRANYSRCEYVAAVFSAEHRATFWILRRSRLIVLFQHLHHCLTPRGSRIVPEAAASYAYTTASTSSGHTGSPSWPWWPGSSSTPCLAQIFSCRPELRPYFFVITSATVEEMPEVFIRGAAFWW